MIIFFAVFISLYFLANSYIFIRGYQSLPSGCMLRLAYTSIFVLLSGSFIAGRFIERISSGPAVNAVIWIGSFWIAMMLYLILGALLVDLLRAINHFKPFFPAFIAKNPHNSAFYAAIAVLLMALVTSGAGYINAANPVLRKVSFSIPGKSANIDSMRAVFISDIHLGNIIRNSKLERIVRLSNSADPDIVLLGGDIVDEDIEPVIRFDPGKVLSSFKTKYGVYGVTGNHEYIGGAEPAVEYLETVGIRMLRDSFVTIDDSFVIAGREDASSKRFSGRERKSLRDVLAGAPKDLPVILMDHQPGALDESAENGIDLHLSGHTHYGQLWPMNYILDAIWRVSYGKDRIADTHIYVSCGAGTWGPPVRTSCRPEVILLDIVFTK